MSTWEINTILVGYDGSEQAERAVELAEEVAQRRKATVIVLTAFPHASRVVAAEDKVSHNIEQADEKAKAALLRLEAAGVKAVKDVAEGPAADALVEAAKIRGVDLIIVGSRGLTPLTNLLLGSTSEEVARRATVPVLIAR